MGNSDLSTDHVTQCDGVGVQALRHDLDHDVAVSHYTDRNLAAVHCIHDNHIACMMLTHLLAASLTVALRRHTTTLRVRMVPMGHPNSLGRRRPESSLFWSGVASEGNRVPVGEPDEEFGPEETARRMLYAGDK